MKELCTRMKWQKKLLIIIALLKYNIKKYTYTLHIRENNLMEKYSPIFNDVCDVARHSEMKM